MGKFCGCFPVFPPCPPQFVVCRNPMITLVDLDTVICGGVLSGTVTCNGVPTSGVRVQLSSSSNVVMFTSAFVTTGAGGAFTAPFTVAPGTEPVSVTLTAMTGGVSESITVTVSCPGGGGNPCACRLTNQAGNPINITRGNQTITFDNGTSATGTLNLFGSICPNCTTTGSSFFTVSFVDSPPDTSQSFEFVIDPTTIQFTECSVTRMVITGSGSAPLFGTVPFTLTVNRPGAPNNSITFTVTAANGFTTTAFNVGNGEMVITPCPSF